MVRYQHGERHPTRSPGATSATYTLTGATADENGETIGVIAGNAFGSVTASVPLSVTDAATALVYDLMPTMPRLSPERR